MPPALNATSKWTIINKKTHCCLKKTKLMTKTQIQSYLTRNRVNVLKSKKLRNKNHKSFPRCYNFQLSWKKDEMSNDGISRTIFLTDTFLLIFFATAKTKWILMLGEVNVLFAHFTLNCSIVQVSSLIAVKNFTEGTKTFVNPITSLKNRPYWKKMINIILLFGSDRSSISVNFVHSWGVQCTGYTGFKVKKCFCCYYMNFFF